MATKCDRKNHKLSKLMWFSLCWTKLLRLNVWLKTVQLWSCVFWHAKVLHNFSPNSLFFFFSLKFPFFKANQTIWREVKNFIIIGFPKFCFGKRRWWSSKFYKRHKRKANLLKSLTTKKSIKPTAMALLPNCAHYMLALPNFSQMPQSITCF